MLVSLSTTLFRGNYILNTKLPHFKGGSIYNSFVLFCRIIYLRHNAVTIARATETCPVVGNMSTPSAEIFVLSVMSRSGVIIISGVYGSNYVTFRYRKLSTVGFTTDRARSAFSIPMKMITSVVRATIFTHPPSGVGMGGKGS